MLPRPHTLLRSIWSTPQLKRRLMRFFGCKKTHFYALLSGLRPSIVKRYCDLIDEALAVDPTGKHAQRLAEYPRRYLRSVIREQAALDPDWNNHDAANDLLKESAEAFAKLNSLDMQALTRRALEETRTELLDVMQPVRLYLARIDARLRSLDEAPQKMPAMRSNLRFITSGAGGQQ